MAAIRCQQVLLTLLSLDRLRLGLGVIFGSLIVRSMLYMYGVSTSLRILSSMFQLILHLTLIQILAITIMVEIIIMEGSKVVRDLLQIQLRTIRVVKGESLQVSKRLV